MSRKSNDQVPVEQRLPLVLAVLAHELTVAEAERVLDDLREDRGEIELADEILDVVPVPIAVVSDNGSCSRGETHRLRRRRSLTGNGGHC